VIHANKDSIKISNIECECVLEDKEHQHSEKFSVGVYEVNLNKLDFKGYRKGMNISIHEDRTYPVLILKDFEKVVRSCKVLKSKTNSSNPVHLYISGSDLTTSSELFAVDDDGLLGRIDDLIQ
jgi:hypothetical protein